jgi:hypothetical protein
MITPSLRRAAQKASERMTDLGAFNLRRRAKGARGLAASNAVSSSCARFSFAATQQSLADKLFSPRI